MKKTLILITIFGCCIFACKKEETFDEFGYFGEGKAFFNGIEWNAKAGSLKTLDICDQDTCIAVALEHSNENGELRGKIVMDFLPMKKGKTIFNYISPSWERIKHKFSFYTLSDDGDVLTGSYHIPKTDSSNFIEITKLDKKTGDIEGNFQVLVIRDSLYTAFGAKRDTIKIKNGTFRSRIKWK